MPRAFPLLAVGLALVFGGCKQEMTRPGGIPLARDQVFQRVVSLSPGATEILAIRGTTKWFVGRTKADNYPLTAARVPIVADLKPNYELLAQIKPDLIVYDASLFNTTDVERLKATGAKLYAIDATTIDAFEKQVYEIGSMLGLETPLAKYVSSIRSAESIAQSSGAGTVTVAIVSPDATGHDYIAGIDSFQADEVRAAGCKPVGPPGTQFMPLNAESLVQLNPDAVVTAGKADDFVKDPRFQTLKAIKAGHVAGVNEDVLLRRGTRVDAAINAIHAIAKGGG